MAISVSEIEKGWIYRTERKQERLVLGWDENGRVVYSSRGGNAMNQFKGTHQRCGEKLFAQKAQEKVRQVNNVEQFIVDNNAQAVVVR